VPSAGDEALWIRWQLMAGVYWRDLSCDNQHHTPACVVLLCIQLSLYESPQDSDGNLCAL